MKQLRDAVDLLSMLEQLTDGLSKGGLSKGERAGSEAPAWGGIKLTLGQAKQLIIKAYEGMSQAGQLERYAEDARLHEDGLLLEAATGEAKSSAFGAGEEVASRGVSSLAGRIQKAPTSSGRVRELLPESPPERSSLSSEQRRKGSSASAPGDI